MKKEVEWNIIDETVVGDSGHIRDLIEGTANSIIDTLRLLVEKPNPALVPIMLLRSFSNCLKALFSFLHEGDRFPELSLMERIHSESGKLKLSMMRSVRAVLCRIILEQMGNK